jgi:hypothetical protein
MTSRLSIAPTGKHPILLRDESGKRITHRAPILANGAPGRNKNSNPDKSPSRKNGECWGISVVIQERNPSDMTHFCTRLHCHDSNATDKLALCERLDMNVCSAHGRQAQRIARH